MENIFKNKGLTSEQVKTRIETNQVNTYDANYSKSDGQIILDNIITPFNIINTVVATALLLVGAYINMLFYIIVVVNTVTAIIQEIKAKRTLEKLAILSTTKVKVVRDNQIVEISPKELVIDDCAILESEDQVSCDATIIEGSLEVNESLLTGESKSIYKYENDEILSGSVIISGQALTKVIHVGQDNFAEKIAIEAKQNKNDESVLIGAMNKAIKLTTMLIVPAALLLFASSLLDGNTLYQAVVTSSASIIGMLPTGVVLLITASLTVGVLRLAKFNVLVQEIYAMENLSRVDMLCLDKTGTLTQGKMQVTNIYSLDSNIKVSDVEQIMQRYLAVSLEKNSTFFALVEHFKHGSKEEVIFQNHFSSQTKWSSTSFANNETYYLGAPDVLLKGKLSPRLEEIINSGERVILLASSQSKASLDVIADDLKPLAAICLLDPLRATTTNTMAYFKEQGVDIRIISGDNPITVSKIAKDAKIDDADNYIDLSSVDDQDLVDVALKYKIFGRAKPQQKKIIIQTLKAAGHTVAMTGDGVNDVLALKEADCSIAMGKGASAARSVSQIVLLDMNFEVLPSVVREGRRVVNNITRVAPIYFVRTFYSGLLTIFAILFSTNFPFIPIQVTLINTLLVGLPTFFMTFEFNNKKISEDFLVSALSRAIPNALSIFIMIMIIKYLPLIQVSAPQQLIIMYGTVAFVTFMTVVQQSKPFNFFRKVVTTLSLVLFIIGLIVFKDYLGLELFNLDSLIIYLVICLCAFVLMIVLRNPIAKLFYDNEKVYDYLTNNKRKVLPRRKNKAQDTK